MSKPDRLFCGFEWSEKYQEHRAVIWADEPLPSDPSIRPHVVDIIASRSDVQVRIIVEAGYPGIEYRQWPGKEGK